ncbi:hypothetical protein Ct61P_09005 [Colletotrichum tofieldiae]|nr:hypothetical protein Ct61P_09005 [Colletotrichum tofieldiae]
MKIPDLQLLTINLSTTICIPSSPVTTATSVTTSVLRVVDERIKPGHQKWAEPQRLSARDGAPSNAFAGPLSVIQIPESHASQRRDDKNCIGIHLCTETNWGATAIGPAF